MGKTPAFAVDLSILGQAPRGIRLAGCECIGLRVCETVNGETISQNLEAIFNGSGAPTGIIKDCDYTLQKGVRLWSKKQAATVPVIDDIGHVMASALKAQFENTNGYKRFTQFTTHGANRLRDIEKIKIPLLLVFFSALSRQIFVA